MSVDKYFISVLLIIYQKVDYWSFTEKTSVKESMLLE